ncbi:MAG TPA: hypothetical protein VMT61_15035 [Candidatus Binataceae bacterium]|nr:hypothetical protein [Candidatus Binataceae bacterium]
MNTLSRNALNLMVLLALAVESVFLSTDWTVALVPAGIVTLFFVNADPILEALMSAWQSSDDAAN